MALASVVYYITIVIIFLFVALVGLLFYFHVKINGWPGKRRYANPNIRLNGKTALITGKVLNLFKK